MKRFISEVGELIFNPRSFFDRNADGIKAGKLLVQAGGFLAIAHWFSSLSTYLWSLSLGSALSERWNSAWRVFFDIAGTDTDPAFRQFEFILGNVQPALFAFLFGIMPLAFAPLISFAKVLFASMIVYIAAWIFIGRRNDTAPKFIHIVTILSFAQTPWLLAFVPVFGHILAIVLAFAVGVVGVSTVYRCGLIRATLTVGFPYLLLTSMVLFFLSVGIFFVLKYIPLISY